MRDLDEPIPPAESLYRWITVEHIDGDEVLPGAVDLQGMSVEREKYLASPLLSAPFSEALNGLALTTVAQLPVSVVVNGVEYEFFAVDQPENGNCAHAEVRPGRTAVPDRPADRPTARRPGGAPARADLRLALAAQMTVFRVPTVP